jgi:anti-sigma factor RsiW
MTHFDEFILNAYLDGELAAEEVAAVAEHLATCASCRAQVTTLGQLFARLERTPDVPIEADLTGRVLAQLAAERWAPTVPRWAPFALAAQAVVTLVILVGAGIALQPVWRTANERLAEVLPTGWPTLSAGELLTPLSDLAGRGGELIEAMRPSDILSIGQIAVLAGVALTAWLVGNAVLLRNQGARNRG